MNKNLNVNFRIALVGIFLGRLLNCNYVLWLNSKSYRKNVLKRIINAVLKIVAYKIWAMQHKENNFTFGVKW